MTTVIDLRKKKKDDPMSNATYLLLDFETQSGCDLIEYGLARHSRDQDTLPYYLAYGWYDGKGNLLPGTEIQLWDWWSNEPIPASLVDWIGRGGLVVAHNIGYDRAIWNHALLKQLRRRQGITLPTPQTLPEIHPDQCVDTAYMSRYFGLPGSLDGACSVLGLPIQKDKAGNEAMRRIMNDLTATPDTHPAEFTLIGEYAKTDIGAMAGLLNNFLTRAQPMPGSEYEVMRMDLHLNDDGMHVDMQMAHQMMMEQIRALAPAENEIKRLTGLNAGQTQALKKWLADNNCPLDSLDAKHIGAALRDNTVMDGVPAEVKRVLRLKQDISRVPKKAEAILKAAVDGRMKHTLMAYGARPTGRWSGRGCANIQLHNVSRPRPKVKDADQTLIAEALIRGDAEYIANSYPPILAALSDVQRLMFKAPDGSTYIDCDYSGIEARMLPWIANDDSLLRAFEEGLDLYIVKASGMFSTPYEEVTKEQRGAAKIFVLAAGYGGGESAVHKMAENYGLKFEKQQAIEGINSYRRDSPNIVALWFALEELVRCALGGAVARLKIGRGHVCELVASFTDGALHIKLPSGRDLIYHDAQLSDIDGESSYTDPETGVRLPLDRGRLANNVTQGLCRDLLVYALQRMREAGLRIVHHVHDEVILESRQDSAQETLTTVKRIMSTTPEWCPGLPIDCEGFIDDRWRKGD